MKKIFFTLYWMLWTSLAVANVVGNGHQNFNTTPDGLDFVTVYSSETLEPGIVNLGLFLNNAVNSLPYFESSTQGRTNFNDTLLGADLNIGYGVMKDWEIGLSAPFILAQTIEANGQSHGEFEKTGNTEIRAMTKYRLWGDESHGFAVIASVNFDRTENNPYGGQKPGPTTNLEIAMDTTVNKWALGFNAGYRKAQPGDPIPGFPMEPSGDQWIASAAGSYLLPRVDTKLIIETFGSLPAQRKSDNANRTASSLELLVGVKHDYTHSIALHFGGGTELMNGASSPDWRVYAGINYTFGPVPKSHSLPFGIEKTSRGSTRIVSQGILFEFDSDRMIPSSIAIIDQIAQEIAKTKFTMLIVAGHTDSIGPEEYNQHLSLLRAQAIRKYLTEKKNIPANMIKAVGKGESEPIADNGNFQGRQLNRRVEFEYY